MSKSRSCNVALMLLRVIKYSVMRNVYIIWIMTNKSLMSNVINLLLLCMTCFVKSSPNETEFTVLCFRQSDEVIKCLR